MSTQSLVAEITEFLNRAEVRMTETTFGRLAVNDGKFVGRLRDGGRVWPETEAKVREFIEHYRLGTRENVAASPPRTDETDGAAA